MTWDACTLVGPWPFARLRYESAADLLRLLERAGIARALVSPLAGAFQQDPGPANQELAAQVACHRDRLLLAAACNPAWPGWQRDLRQAQDDLGAVGLRLFPSYHGYQLGQAEVAALAALAADCDLPVFITLRLQDERLHPPAFLVSAVPWEEVAALAQAHPGTRFVMSMGRFAELIPALRQTAGTGNLYADIAGVQGPTRCLDRLVAEVGADRLLFGTELLFQYAAAATLKVEHSGLSPRDRQALCMGNLQRLLRLPA